MHRISLKQGAEDRRGNAADNEQDRRQREHTGQERMAMPCRPAPTRDGGVGARAKFVRDEQRRQDHGDRLGEDREQNNENGERVPEPPLARSRCSERPQPREKRQDNKDQRHQILAR